MLPAAMLAKVPHKNDLKRMCLPIWAVVETPVLLKSFFSTVKKEASSQTLEGFTRAQKVPTPPISVEEATC